MIGRYLLTLEGRAEPVEVSTDQRDLFALRRRGYRECGYETAEAAMAIFETTINGNVPTSDAELAKVGLEALTTLTWLTWHACERLELTTSDFDTFAERELIAMAPLEEIANGKGAAVTRPTARATSVGGSPGSRL